MALRWLWLWLIGSSCEEGSSLCNLLARCAGRGVGGAHVDSEPTAGSDAHWTSRGGGGEGGGAHFD